MPYKDQAKQKEAMRKIMRNYRKMQYEAMKQLKTLYPNIYNEIFGKKRRHKK